MAAADLHALLVGSSRTFAIAIPSLPEPTRKEVTVAYLLCRLLDTVEDAARWPAQRRLAALSELAQLTERPCHARAARLARRLVKGRAAGDPGCRRLLDELPVVIDAYQGLSVAALRIVGSHARRMAEGMARFVSRADARGELRLYRLADLREYCYVVAGIVGELLTELFLADTPPLLAVAGGLRRRAALFGEGLQLVNVLRDAEDDAREGRHLLPARVGRPRLVALARRDLSVAAEYVRALERAGGPPGLVAFAALPVQLAGATLDCVLRDGPGAKVSRRQLAAIQAEVGITSSRGVAARG